jgi:hypothetical protein
MVVQELNAAKRKAERLGFKLCVRLNGTSDLRWEDIKTGFTSSASLSTLKGDNLFDLFPDIQFYDYTKIPNRKVSHIKNYHLTYSYAPVTHQYLAKAQDSYGLAVNLAVVFAGALPKHYLGRDVYDGDESDLRFLDPKGVVIGLKAKGKAKTQPSGLVAA